MDEPNRIAALERRVEQLEAAVELLIGQTRASPGAGAEHPADLLQLIRGGELIPAIARYRALYGGGLKEAKDAVEALARDL